MRRKGIFTILAAVFMVLAFSAMAFAANQVFLKTTVPNIPKSTCWQAGTDTMEFDHLSNMAEGDVIEFTLNNNVTVCKAINMFVTFGTDGRRARHDRRSPRLDDGRRHHRRRHRRPAVGFPGPGPGWAADHPADPAAENYCHGRTGHPHPC